jgi:hypothetical protein
MNIMGGSKSSLYDEDFLRWTEENAALLRSGNVGEAASVNTQNRPSMIT